MKKLILLILIATAGWQGFNKWSQKQADPQNVASTEIQELSGNDSPAFKPEPVARTFTCDGRQHCSQMSSKEEAEYFLQHCPDVKMDGDGDGIPCEQQFGF